MTKIADTRPPHCASCFQHPEGRCIDFEAAYDGPVIPGTPTPVPIDDLVLCEDCLAEAFRLLDPQGLRQTVTELEDEVTRLSGEVEAKDRMIQGFRSTTNELVEHPVRTFPGKPKLEGVSPEVRKLITRNRRERAENAKRAKGKPKKEGAKAEAAAAPEGKETVPA